MEVICSRCDDVLPKDSYNEMNWPNNKLNYKGEPYLFSASEILCHKYTLQRYSVSFKLGIKAMPSN